MATWDFDWLSSRRLTNQNVIVLWLFEILIGQAAANQLIRTASSWNIIIQWTSHDDLTEKSAETFFILQYGDPKEKTCQMTEIQNCTLWFDKKTASVEFCQHAVLDWDFAKIFKSIWKPNPCMDPLEKKIYSIKIYSIFWWESPFHREWLALIDILMI